MKKIYEGKTKDVYALENEITGLYSKMTLQAKMGSLIRVPIRWACLLKESAKQI